MISFTPAQAQVSLRVAGKTFSGWTSITIESSIETVSRSFTVSAVARWPKELHKLRLRPGSSVEVYVGEDLAITGWIDSLSTSFSGSTHSITVSGRSKTCDLVDCTAIAEPGHWRSIPALSLARLLAASYGVEVVSLVPDLEDVPRFVLSDSETVEAALQRLAALRSVLLTDDTSGRLVITRAGTARADVALVVGENVLEGSSTFDASGRFSEYRVRSVRVPSGQDFGTAIQSGETAVDTEVFGRTRVLELSAESGEDASRTRQRATWEAATRYGKSITVNYEVQGWRQGETGRLWTANEIVRVSDTISGISGDYLLTDVSLTLSEAGTRARLTLAPPEGFELLPPQAPRPARRKKPPAANPFSALADGVEQAK